MKSDAGVVPDDDITYGVIYTTIVLNDRTVPQTERIEWSDVGPHTTVNHGFFSGVGI
jgi:hypothetical protein